MAVAIHNHTTKHTKSATYISWEKMLSRCNRPADPGYRWYGARGIKVCDRWRKFENFLADLGERPRDRTLDRIDVNGNYEPSNCRWATAQEQRSNKRPYLPKPGSRSVDLVGQKYGRLTVVRFAMVTPQRFAKWHCVCECGETVTCFASSLKSGQSQSCGCLKREIQAARMSGLRKSHAA